MTKRQRSGKSRAHGKPHAPMPMAQGGGLASLKPTACRAPSFSVEAATDFGTPRQSGMNPIPVCSHY